MKNKLILPKDKKEAFELFLIKEGYVLETPGQWQAIKARNMHKQWVILYDNLRSDKFSSDQRATALIEKFLGEL